MKALKWKLWKWHRKDILKLTTTQKVNSKSVQSKKTKKKNSIFLTYSALVVNLIHTIVVCKFTNNVATIICRMFKNKNDPLHRYLRTVANNFTNIHEYCI